MKEVARARICKGTAGGIYVFVSFGELPETLADLYDIKLFTGDGGSLRAYRTKADQKQFGSVNIKEEDAK